MSHAVSILISALPELEGSVFGPTAPKSVYRKKRFYVKGRRMKRGLKFSSDQGQPCKPRLAKNEHIYAILATQFGGQTANPPPFLRPPGDFDDVDYYLPPLAMVKNVFRERLKLTKGIAYWPEVFDCDDYVYCLKTVFSLHRFRTADLNERYAAMAVGALWGGPVLAGHVVNVVVTADAGVCIVDSTSSSKTIYAADEWTDPVRYIVI